MTIQGLLPHSLVVTRKRRSPGVLLQHLLPAMLAALALAMAPAPAHASSAIATTSTGGDWTTATTWVCSGSVTGDCVPNNGFPLSTDTYSVGINSGSVLLFPPGGSPLNIAVDALTVSQSGSLEDLNAGLAVGGSITNSGTLDFVNGQATAGEFSNTGSFFISGSSGSFAASGSITNSGNSLDVEGAKVTATGGLTNTGQIELDTSSEGGSLAAGGPLTNYAAGSYGSITVGNSNLQLDSRVSVNGLADSTGNPTNTWEGQLSINSGQATASLVTGAAIMTIDTNSGITLTGANAFVELGPNDGANTALKTLAVNKGSLVLQYGGQITTTGGLINSGTLNILQAGVNTGGDLNNSGNISVQSMSDLGVGGSLINSGGNLNVGLSDATVTGELTNSGSIHLDGANLTVGGSVTNSGGSLDVENSKMSATGGLTNNGQIEVDTSNNGGGGSLAAGGPLTNYAAGTYGSITIGGTNLQGTSMMSVEGLADSNGKPTNTWEGQLSVTSGSGTAKFVTAAPITAIDSNSGITLNGPKAYVELGLNDGANTALNTLAANKGSLDLEQFEQLTANNSLTNSGAISVDAVPGTGVGSSLVVGGALTNYAAGNYGNITVGNLSLFSGTSMMSVKGLADSNGKPTNTWEGQLSVTTGAPAATAEFVTAAPITAIDSNSGITIDGSTAYVEVGSTDNRNSALDTLASISGSGSLDLEDNASVTTQNGVISSGNISIDNNPDSGGSSLAVGNGTGSLTNSGNMTIGNANMSAQGGVSVGAFSNSGTVYLNGNSSLAGATGTLEFNGPGTYDNTANAKIVMAGGAITGATGSESLTNEGSIQGNGSIAGLALTNSGTVTPDGTLTITPSTSSGFTTSGSVSVGAGDTLALSGANAIYNQIGGSGTIDGTLLTKVLNLSGGTLSGNGAIGSTASQADVTNSGGTIHGGNSPGTMTINGNYTQGANGAMLTEIASASNWDVLDVIGTAELGGTLDISLLNSFLPANGETFTILDATDGLTGMFSSYTSSFGTNGMWNIIYGSNTVAIEAQYQSSTTPEPSALILVGFALAALAAFRMKSEWL